MKSQLADYFAENFASRGECGASLSVWKDGEEFVSLHAGLANRKEGSKWDENTLAPVWSASKGPASAALLLALDESGMNLETSVSELWPELKVARERGLNVGQLMSHQAGLAAIDDGEKVDARDYSAVIAALEKQAPQKNSAGSHAYHPRTFGYLLDELMRRLSGGMSLGEFWRQRIARPLDLDFYFALPEEMRGRVARLYPAKIGRLSGGDGGSEFFQSYMNRDSLTHRAFVSPGGLAAVADMNRQENWSLELPAWGGIGTARALAKFYAVLAAGGEWKGKCFFPPRVIEWMRQRLVAGFDQVLRQDTAFSAGFMKAPIGTGTLSGKGVFGVSLEAFGHPGAGGSLAFADPDRGIAFAYVMNQMVSGVFPDQKALGLVDILNKCNSV